MNDMKPEKLVELAGRIRSIGDRIGTINRMAVRVSVETDTPLASSLYLLACDLCGSDFDGYASTGLPLLFATFIRTGLQAESDRLRREMAEVAREIGGTAGDAPEVFIRHGYNCPKKPHAPGCTGYMHDENDDRAYDVDGETYCGRCHVWLPECQPAAEAAAADVFCVPADKLERGQE